MTTPLFSKWPERTPVGLPRRQDEDSEKMELNIPQNVGVDISKDFLDVAFYPPGKPERFANNAKGHRALIKRLAPLEVERVVFEATGAYHRLFERTLAEAGLPTVKVNPRRARQFCQAAGKLAKTDRCDAAMLARMGAVLELSLRPVVSRTRDEMKQLLVARDALVKHHAAVLNRQKTADLPLIKTQLAATLRQNEKQTDAIDNRLKELRRGDPELQAQFEILISIPGIGEITANVLLIEMPELGQLEQGEAASLTGVAPVANDSGKSSGPRSIRGGRSRVRSALYMAAVSASQHHPELSIKYNAMLKDGKLPKVALTALIRKLVILANALLRDKRKWSPSASQRGGKTRSA
jgi:transposase